MTASARPAGEQWEFAGWGNADRITDLDTGPTTVKRLDQPVRHLLGSWRATAICGNDITSSVLYVSGLCAAQAGALAPIVLLDRVNRTNEWVRTTVYRRIDEIKQRSVVYFTKGDGLPVLNKAALYVLKNEQTNRLLVVHVYEDPSAIPPELAEHLQTIDHLYPQLRVDFLAVKGKFGPELIERLSQRLGVAKNYMFIGTPGDRFPHRIEQLGGVRLII